ncbi:tail protein X [Roseibium salinum]|uniref:Tail protein X n=1 Tax=Roseibium salinum TaxID=1604349 RepID=A0ABT3R0H9_9HYPH|nr:tail protein X [Roseibium sp. DSM 29163]MCX2722626.1 tail protein X [Roseibium sp. DSM 29163]MDN3719411.1 tail protein X [Roseibium salinum]
MPQAINVVGDNLTLDLILWRKYGVRGQALVEETMALNPDLRGPFLPVGAVVTLPDLPSEQTATREVVTLFG